MIPRNVIDSLKCSSCKNILSVFPVYSYGSRETVICGRCSVQNDFLPQRQDLYEELAQHIEFSCQYQNNGCVEKLRPVAMKNHEEHCIHKPCFCPILPLGECKWHGDYSDLFDHYTDSHPALSFRDFRIEIDIVSSYEENYVFQQLNETVIAQLKCDAASGKFYCNVISSGSKPKTKKLLYNACFTNNKEKFSCEVNDVEYIEAGAFTINDKTTAININDIILKLNNPSCVICKIELHELVTATQSDTSSISSFEHEDEMLSTLECPICFEYMVPPIMQCNAGCSFCGSHRVDLSECPKCRGSVGGTRNYLLEKITDIIEYPCKHSEHGCSFRSNAKNIKAHESSCICGPFKCIIESCVWQNSFSNLRPHLQQNHKDNILETNFLTYILVDDIINETYIYILLGNDNIFKLLFSRDNDIFHWSLQIVGCDEDCDKYMLELDFDYNSIDRIYVRKRCGPLINYSSIQNDLVIRLNMTQLKTFIVDDLLTYKARIIEIK